MKNFLKILSFVKTPSYNTILILGTPSPLNPITYFAVNSTNLSPMTNSESKRYHYPVCHPRWPPIIPYPDSKVQREAQGVKMGDVGSKTT
jgi:hypothetical protein